MRVICRPYHGEFLRCVMRCDYFHTNRFDAYKQAPTFGDVAGGLLMALARELGGGCHPESLLLSAVAVGSRGGMFVPGWGWVGLGLLVGIYALHEGLTRGGSIALPLSQPFYFSDSTERANEDEIAWPIPPTRDGAKVVLYRAIDPPELAFVRNVGFTNYGFSPNASGKYFALTLAGVTQFAGADINSYAVFTLTQIRVSPPIILLGYFFNDVGQQGAGWSIHFSDEALVGLYADLATSNEHIVIIGAV